MEEREFELKHVLHKPLKDTGSKTGVIVLPGISGDPLGARYNILGDALAKSRIYCLRFAIWENESDLTRFSMRDLYDRISLAVDYLKSLGCEKIGAVGKSLGGAILLHYNERKIDASVLWAPAIGFYEKENVSELMDVKFSSINGAFDFRIDNEMLSKLDSEILILQGTADKSVPRENSEKICNNLPSCKIEFLEGFGHSYDKLGEIEAVDMQRV